MPQQTQLLFGTQNKAKCDHMRVVLSTLPIDIISPQDIQLNLRVAETGTTPIENAKIKAQAYYQASQMPTFSIDAGLIIDKFPPEKQPGVYVRRVQGTEKSDDEMIAYYTQELQKVGGQSKATWHVGVALATKNGVLSDTYHRLTTLTAKASATRIVGAPLSALQKDPKTNRYLSELSWEERTQVQMRGDAEVRTFIQTHFLDTLTTS